MEIELIFKALILVILLMILISLTAGMFFIIKDKGQSNRALTSLKLRISLSVALFVLIVIGLYFGWLTPGGHAVMPKP